MTKNPKEPENWFDRHGVDRPEHIPFMTEDELEKKFAEIRKNTVHGGWKQKGNYIFCTRCPNEHGDFIKPAYLLKGTDEKGLPILTKVV